MTRLRIPALAQALVIVVILLPGPLAGGPVLAQGDGVPDAGGPGAADGGGRRDEPAGRGLGCTSGVGSFRGPRLPGDPPAPPGSGPEATPVPSIAPGVSPAPSDGATQELDGPDSELGQGSTALLASTGALLAQADPTASPSPADEAATVPAVDEPADQRPRRGDRARVRGIDVSHHNGDIDYADVLDSGRSFVFVKATQDTSFRDPMFETNVHRARQAGVLTGAYHFFDYTLDGADQADHFLAHIERAGGPLGWLPPVVDIECWRPSGISTHVTSAERLRDFIDRIYERIGVLPIVYTSVFMWDEVMGKSSGFGDLPLWAACWGCASPPSLASGWDDWLIWQTGTARIPRVGRLDGNQFNGSRADLGALVLRPFRVEGGSLVTADTTVELDLGGRDGDEIRTSPDGVTWTDWRPLRDPATAELEAVEGPQTLYAQLRARGAESPVLRDEIVLELATPATPTPAPTPTAGLETPEPSASDPGSPQPSEPAGSTAAPG